jgi:hypothetical protein
MNPSEIRESGNATVLPLGIGAVNPSWRAKQLDYGGPFSFVQTPKKSNLAFTTLNKGPSRHAEAADRYQHLEGM